MSTKKNTFDTFFSAEKMNEMFRSFQAPMMNIDAVLDVQRKNLDTLTKVNQKAFDCMQACMKQQNEMFTKLVSDQAKSLQETMNSGTPEQGLQKQAEFAQVSYETSMKCAQEMGEMLTKANDEVSDIVSKRVTASVNEMKDVVANTTKDKKAA
jgi:phasin family protein